MEDDEIMIEDDAIALEDTDDSVAADSDVAGIIPFIMERYRRAEDYRYQDEERWLKAYRNYRGLYGPDVQFTESEKSRVFIKVTKTKTLAAYGQIVDVLFANNKFPLAIEPTELPEGVVADVHFDPQNHLISLVIHMGLQEMVWSFRRVLLRSPYVSSLGPLTEKLEPVEDKLKEGPGKTPTAIEFSPAMVAAKTYGKENPRPA